MTAQSVEEKAPEAKEVLSRFRRRENMLLGKKILKLFAKGYTARKIAHAIGYKNIDRGEQDIIEFIRETYARK